ncbi:MAG TPA: sensor histidine kinase [Solirubrobacterales bacterium]|nr:sensor histidine kinase [Solirubrobacterales bacterium]
MTERDAAALDAVVAVARALGGRYDLDSIFDLIAKRGRALVSARALAVEVSEGGRTVVAAAAGELRKGELDPQAEPEGSVLVVPLALRGRPYGALVAVDRQGDQPRFTIADEELLEALAAGAATAMATAQMLDPAPRRERLAAEEAERAAWARELHDGALRGLDALRMSLAAMEEADPADAQELLQGAIADAEAEAEKLRGLIADLRPVVLDQLGLAAAIESLADRLEVPELEIRTSIDLAFEEGRAEDRLHGELETAIYRIVQEALSNALEHAGASRVLVEVAEDDVLEEVRLLVRDDGGGFDPGAEGEGLGLTLMRERAELFGGSIEIRSGREGTRIDVVLPADRRGRSMLNTD